MKLVLGVGVVGSAVIEYFKDTNICFYDDHVRSFVGSSDTEIPFFSSWNDIDLVIVSPGIMHDHFMIKEAQERGVRITSDVELFLLDKDDYVGFKIGVTGTNGKSTLCSLLKFIFGDLAELGGNFGVSPLSFSFNSFYIIELSSYQLSWLSAESLSNLDISVITNIGAHHLKYHGSMESYVNVKQKISLAKKFVDGRQLALPESFPNNPLFKRVEYQIAWGIILQILDLLNLDEKKALIKLEGYIPLKYRQECILDTPLVINDSKSTNVGSMKCALNNMMKDFVLIAQVFDYSEEGVQNLTNISLLKKVFILSNNSVNDLNVPYYVSNDFELVVNNALTYAVENDLNVLFSPGMQSFEFFQNFEDRGEQFNKLVDSFFKK